MLSKTQRLPKIDNIEALDSQDLKTAPVTRLCPCPAPFSKEKSTRLHVPICAKKYQDYQSEGGVFWSSSAYEKTVSVLHPFC